MLTILINLMLLLPKTSKTDLIVVLSGPISRNESQLGKK